MLQARITSQKSNRFPPALVVAIPGTQALRTGRHSKVSGCHWRFRLRSSYPPGNCSFMSVFRFTGGESTSSLSLVQPAFDLDPSNCGHHRHPKTSGGYCCAGIDRPRRHVPSHQYSPAVISPASGYIVVNGSAAQRTKNSKKLSVGGPESGPLLFQSIHVSGTNTAAPSTSPSRQTLKLVIGRNKESRNREGKKKNIVMP